VALDRETSVAFNKCMLCLEFFILKKRCGRARKIFFYLNDHCESYHFPFARRTEIFFSLNDHCKSNHFPSVQSPPCDTSRIASKSSSQPNLDMLRNRLRCLSTKISLFTSTNHGDMLFKSLHRKCIDELFT
jgi:hypothetical protein